MFILSGLQKKTNITILGVRLLCSAPISPKLFKTLHMHNNSSPAVQFYPPSPPSHNDRSPAVSFNAVDAAGPIGSGGNIVQVRSHHASAARTRAVDLGGGVVQALVRQLFTGEVCGDGWRKMDIAFIRLIYLWLVGEQDLGLWTAEGRGGKKESALVLLQHSSNKSNKLFT